MIGCLSETTTCVVAKPLVIHKSIGLLDMIISVVAKIFPLSTTTKCTILMMVQLGNYFICGMIFVSNYIQMF